MSQDPALLCELYQYLQMQTEEGSLPQGMNPMPVPLQNEATMDVIPQETTSPRSPVRQERKMNSEPPKPILPSPPPPPKVEEPLFSDAPLSLTDFQEWNYPIPTASDSSKNVQDRGSHNRDSSRDRERDRDRDGGRNRDHDRDRNRDRNRDRDRDRDRNSDRNRDRDRYNDRNRDRERNNDYDRDRNSDRDRYHDRDARPYDKNRGSSRSFKSRKDDENTSTKRDSKSSYHSSSRHSRISNDTPPLTF